MPVSDTHIASQFKASNSRASFGSSTSNCRHSSSRFGGNHARQDVTSLRSTKRAPGACMGCASAMAGDPSPAAHSAIFVAW